MPTDNFIFANLPTIFGTFRIAAFKDELGKENSLLVFGKINPSEPTLLRVHSECLTGDVFKSTRCDCGQQLEESMKLIVEHGSGIIIYLRQEGRGIGLINKLNAYNLQDQGHDTYDANIELGFPVDLREYDLAVEVLKKLNISQVKLITNNPKKISAFEKNDIKVIERITLNFKVHENSKSYLLTKKNKFKHL